MELTQLQQSYYQQLLKVGITGKRALMAAKSLDELQLLLIREIWSDWSN